MGPLDGHYIVADLRDDNNRAKHKCPGISATKTGAVVNLADDRRPPLSHRS